MKQDQEWTRKDTAQCVGMLALTGGALAACTGHLSIDDIRAYMHTAGEFASTYAVVAVAGLGGTVLAVGVLLLLVRHLRAALAAMARTYWIYRRRWAAVITELELTTTTPSGTKTPRLRSVVRIGDEDVVSVRMAQGQSAAMWHEKSAALAYEFGATSARVSFGDQPQRDIEIAFYRPQQPAPRRREQLALPAPQQHPYPLTLPVPVEQPRQRQQARPVTAIRISGLRLQIIWAHIPRTGHDGSIIRMSLRQRYGLRGELRWATWATAM